MKTLSRCLWGLALVCIGIIIALNSLEITDINIFFKGWWTLFIIVPSFIDLCTKENKTGSLIALAIGVILLLASRGIIDFDIVAKLIIPVILIACGLLLIFNGSFNSSVPKKVKDGKSKDIETIAAVFGEQKVDKSGESFSSADLEAIFGGVTVDLREAKIKKDAVITAFACFGGVTIKVPNDVTVKIKSTPIFGGVSNKKKEKYFF